MTRPAPTWANKGDDPDGRHARNGHILALGETDWRCELCGHTFDAAADAERFRCGESCTGRHPGGDQS